MNKAAQALGRLGGLVKSKAKKLAGAANMAKARAARKSTKKETLK